MRLCGVGTLAVKAPLSCCFMGLLVTAASGMGSPSDWRTDIECWRRTSEATGPAPVGLPTSQETRSWTML